MKKYRIIKIPNLIKVTKGKYKDWLGEVWYSTPQKYQAVTSHGWYFTVLKEEASIIATKGKRVLL